MIVPVQLHWNPFNQLDPGPCIKVIIANTDETIEAGRAIGFEYPAPHKITALLDTGSPFTIVNRIHALNRMLTQTGAGTEIRTLGGKAKCGEHSGTISFPGTGLKPIETLRILSRDFEEERYYSCLIGRDVLRHWNITFDGRSKRVTITD
jgi:hypothetical protein